MEIEVTCPSCAKPFNVVYDARIGVADCPHCGVTMKFDAPQQKRAIAPGAPAQHGTGEIHHLPSHANLHVSHKTVPMEEPPKPSGSIMEMAVWFVVIVAGIGSVWWWVNRPPPPEEPKTWRPDTASSPAQPARPATEVVEVALSNPGFQKMLEGWNILQTAGMVRVMTEAAHSGDRGLRVADDSTESETVVTCPFMFTRGDNYECRFWARVVSGKGAVVSLQFSNAEGVSLGSFVEVPGDTKQWKEFAVTSKAPIRAVKGEIWIATTDGGTVLADFDDFRLYKFK
jgi:hypothetical protein